MDASASVMVWLLWNTFSKLLPSVLADGITHVKHSCPSRFNVSMSEEEDKAAMLSHVM